MIIKVDVEIETSEVIIEVDNSLVVSKEFVNLEIENDEVSLEIEEQIYVGPPGPAGIPGPVGPPGPPGGFEIIPITIAEPLTWYPVPLSIITYVVDVVAYDQTNREKVEIDVRINLNQTVEVMSKLTKTYNIHVSGI